MSSPLNQLADALPSFLRDMQELKLRQDRNEALNTYQQGLLAARIERNRLTGIVQDEQQRLGVIDRDREISEDMFRLEAEGKGWAAAKYGREMVAQFFPEGIPGKREKPDEPKKPSLGKISRVLKRRDTLIGTINERTTSIRQMRKSLGLAPGEEPGPAKTFFGFVDEQRETDIKSFNTLRDEREKAQADFDRLKQGAQAEGIDFELTAPSILPFQDNAEDPAGIFK